MLSSLVWWNFLCPNPSLSRTFNSSKLRIFLSNKIWKLTEVSSYWEDIYLALQIHGKEHLSSIFGGELSMMTELESEANAQ